MRMRGGQNWSGLCSVVNTELTIQKHTVRTGHEQNWPGSHLMESTVLNHQLMTPQFLSHLM